MQWLVLIYLDHSNQSKRIINIKYERYYCKYELKSKKKWVKKQLSLKIIKHRRYITHCHVQKQPSKYVEMYFCLFINKASSINMSVIPHLSFIIHFRIMIIDQFIGNICFFLLFFVSRYVQPIILMKFLMFIERLIFIFINFISF